MDVRTTVRPPRHAKAADLPALAERDMLTCYAEALDCPPLTPKAVLVAGDTFVQIDGVSPDEDLFVIPISWPDVLPEDASAHLARDAFALSLVRTDRPGARTVLLFCSPPALRSARAEIGRIAGPGIELALVDLGQEWHERLIEAGRPAGRHRAPSTGTATTRR